MRVSNDGQLILPGKYVEMDQDEMQYVEGGAISASFRITVTGNLLKAAKACKACLGEIKEDPQYSF